MNEDIQKEPLEGEVSEEQKTTEETSAEAEQVSEKKKITN